MKAISHIKLTTPTWRMGNNNLRKRVSVEPPSLRLLLFSRLASNCFCGVPMVA